jgi:hypothetical protein
MQAQEEKHHLLNDWYNIQTELKTLKDQEMQLRKELFTLYFPQPTVGKNKIALDDDYILEGGYNLDYKMDFMAFRMMCNEGGEEHGVCMEDVVDYKPEFRLALYKTLTTEQQQFIDGALTIKPTAPTLNIKKVS